jgi:hypothetical protein
MLDNIDMGDSTPVVSSTPASSQEPSPEEAVVESNEAVVEEQPASGAVTETGVITPTKGVRDYKGIDEADIIHFKQMSDGAYKYFRPLYDARKANDTKYGELEKQYNAVKDQQYYQHPNAYVLSEEYSKAEKDYTTKTRIANHWQNALATLEEQGSIRDLRIYDDGRVEVADEELSYSPQLKAQVTAALNRSITEAQQAKQQALSIKDTYANKHKAFDTQLSQAEAALIAEVKDSESFKAAVLSMSKIIPPELRGNRQYQLIANMGAYINLMKGEIEAVRSKLNGKAAIRKVAASSGPGEGRATTSGNQDDENPEAFLKNFKRHIGRV